ncbi:MAG TPA: alpha/beta hydrolase [Blastocatellia bacterium]|nr:alpha/beta hydrolase [Blastocatellia bacterium]
MKHTQSWMAMLVVIATALLAADAQPLQQGGQLQDPPWIKALAAKRIVYALPGMERVRVQKNLTYKQVAGSELKMDVYSPASARPSARRPAVIFIHGGRIPRGLRTTPKDWGAFVSYGQLVAASGMVGVTFNHRFYAWESLADSQSDVTDAVNYVRSHAEALGVDRDRIILWAVSAGGIFLSQTLRDAPPFVRCLVCFYAELDLQNLRRVAPASVSDETLRAFSPVYHLSQNKKNTPPIFIARAGLDAADLNSGVDRFVQMALANNLTVEVMNHPAGHHGFDVDDNNERSREIIKRGLAFIKTHG